MIITEMHYPLYAGKEADHNAGFILIEELERREINIPVFICSTRNYNEFRALGCVLYSELTDIEFDFKEILQRL